MSEFAASSLFFGPVISLLGYAIGMYLRKKTKLEIVNPLIVAIVFIIVVLNLFHIDYESYNASAKYLSYLLTPATVALAIPLYQQLDLLKKNFLAVILGILSGVISSLGSILGLCVLFGVSHEYYVSLLPKSITTAIGISVAEELGGIPTVTVAAICITGILGGMIGQAVCRLFRITEPISVGLAHGTAAHAIGTSKAIEIGEVEGAMSSLSIAVAGVLTVIFASVFAGLH
ncbi:MAG: LrgB family protein [Eubacteriales bacterium]|nr:LrgB family protein [Eubacteriales bacterium]